MYDIRLMTDASAWDAFVKNQTNTLFVQSSHYANFYRALGEDGWMIGIFDGEMLIGGTVAVSVRAKRGSFLYLPYGPILPEEGTRAFRELTAYLRVFAKERRLDFVRVSAFWDDTEAMRRLFRDNGFRNAPMHMLAETTWIADLSPDESTLLSAMNKNHRNLIRRCAAEGVRTEVHTDAAALNRFNALHDHTAARHGFHRFSADYITKEFAAFAPYGEAAIIEGYLPDGTLDASAIILFYGTMACYRHGASIGTDKRLPASYAVQWEAIREAKRRGMRRYNFWGIAPDGASMKHPFYGITHFKKGFGGAQKQVLHCQDLPVSPLYWLAWGIETGRRFKRGF
jgi:lipid II:glycine glycyltransferase (peptidoglycan interpeptide bridge formation enzyme)